MTDVVQATTSSVTLTPVSPDGPPLQLTTDPQVKTAWKPRKATEAGLGGAVTTWDFGQVAKDCIRTLTWAGKGQWLDRDAVAQLRTWLGVAGSTYRYQDDEGNDWTVEILAFDADREFKMPRSYTATLELHVLAMDALLGTVYTGA